MVAALAFGFVALAVLGLGFYAVSKMRPGSFRLRASLLRVFSFSLEVESSRAAGRPVGEAGWGNGPEGRISDGGV
jgi:hypothetical protein